MNPRTTGMLLAVAVALGAFVYFYEIGGEQGRREAEERSKQLFSEVDAEDIEVLAFDTSDGIAVRLERREAGWELIEPLVFPADAFAADGLASSLAGLVSEAELEDPQPPQEYGLADGARLLRFRLADDERGLRFGNETPIGSNTYAMLDGGEKIFTVKSIEARRFEKSFVDLRERRILAFDPSAIERLEVSWPGGAVELERASAEPDPPADEESDASVEKPGDRSWRVVAPVAAVADGETVDQLLSDLSFLRADDFVDDPADDAELGLAEPAFEVVLTGATVDGEPVTHRIEIGDIYEGETRLVRSGHPSLFVIAAARAAGFPRKLVDYRYRTLAKFPAADAVQVDFFFQPRSGDPVAVTSMLEGGAWSSSPEAIASDKLERLVAELSQLKAADILADSAEAVDLVELGLSPPDTIITVFGRAEGEGASEDDSARDDEGEEDLEDPPERPRLAEIHIGRVEASEWIIARAVGDPVIYRLDYELAEHLPVSLDALRNRFIEAGAPEDAALPEVGDLDPEFLLPSQESP